MRFLTAVLFSMVLGLASLPAHAVVDCKGRFFNPITDPNWMNFFPITILGLKLGPNSDPPLMSQPPICICPSRVLGIPMIGIGISFWQPQYIAEVQRSPGCMSSLGGLSLLSSFKMQASEQDHAHGDDTGDELSRMQMHWYQYPIFYVLELFKEIGCLSSSGFALAYMTEIDPTWQNDLWGAVWAPEATLFTDPLTQTVCSVDSIASTVAYPIDALFWCQGTAGQIYPLTGNSQHGNSNQATNMQILGKFLARAHRMLLLFSTIGPQAECTAYPMPFIVKSQYRIDQVYPTRVRGAPVYLGQSEFRWGLLPPANYATEESSTYLIWQGQQCCLRF